MHTTRMIALLCLLVLLGTMQVSAVDYKNTYQQSDAGYQAPGYRIATTATAPTATFQSTSAYSEQWSEQSTLLKPDGSVNAELYGVGRTTSGPRKVGGTPGGNPPDEEQQPLGEGWILLVMAGAYAVVRRLRFRV